MNFNNKIRSLHQTDEATAQTIMQQCPAQWDMEKVFQKTYQNYLFQKQENAAFAGECTEALPCPAPLRSFRRLWKTGAYAACAAAFLGLFLFFSQMDGKAPNVERIPDGIHESNPSLLDENTDTEPTAESVISETEPIATTAIYTTASEETTEQTTPSVSETSETTFIEITPPPTTEEQIPDPTEAMTVPPVTQTEPPAVTGTPEPESTASTTPESTVPETTTTTTTTTEPPVISLGHFETSEQSGGFFQITYVREDTAPVEEQEHSFAAEGFTLTNVQVDNADYDYRSVVYRLEDAAGQSYMIRESRYDYFMPSFNPEYYPLTKSYTIDGKTVFLVYQEDPESVCHLMWDDGCHVCEMISQYKDLAQMELLVLSQITN